MYVALVAYGVYAVNAGQFLLKLRAARLDEAASRARTGPAIGVTA
jgi:3-vinyl bacteriochlorophyllide hydratase